jgi:translation initiation factor 2B subunit (eIF-2B alpha/beta/delta family)
VCLLVVFWVWKGARKCSGSACWSDFFRVNWTDLTRPACLDGSRLDWTVRNVYFEATPLAAFAGIVTEDGVLSAAEISDEIHRRREVYRRAFRLD